MKKNILPFTLALFAMLFINLSPCQASNKKLIGTWIPVEYSFVGEAKPQSFLDSTSLKINADGSGISTTNGKPKKGNWTVKADILTFTFSLGSQKIEVEYTLVDDKLIISNYATKAVFVRKK